MNKYSDLIGVRPFKDLVLHPNTLEMYLEEMLVDDLKKEMMMQGFTRVLVCSRIGVVDRIINLEDL